jgi:ubiquinone/menaquinone biosynthesis C-methylase UbiE
MKITPYNKKFYLEPTEILFQENAYLKHILKALKPKGKTCLDFGCGTGYWCDFLFKCGASVIGIDKKQELMQKGAFNDGICYVLWETTALPFGDNTFEIVLVSWVFQEIIEDDIFSNAISELKRVMKRRGRLVVVDNFYPDSRVLYKKTHLGDLFGNLGKPDILRFFPQNSVKEIMRCFSLVPESRQLCGHSFFEVYYKDE